MGEKSLRADAQLNQGRLLEAAARAFARDGADTSLKAIAKDAGVGIGTLYRRFPTRDDLIEATYRNETMRLCERAAELLAVSAARDALHSWSEDFVDYMLTKTGMAEALPAILAARDGLRAHSRDLLRDAIGTLLTAGVAEGSIRDDVPANDVMMALGGITLIAGHESQRQLGSRLLALLIDGLSPITDQGHSAVVMTDLPRVGAPATRALRAAGYQTLESLAGAATADLLGLHGSGPRAVRIIGEALVEAGLPPLR